MYDVNYQGGIKFTLTKEERQEAVKIWNEKQTYYCKRLDAFLSPFFLSVAPQRDDISERRKL